MNSNSQRPVAMTALGGDTPWGTLPEFAGGGYGVDCTPTPGEEEQQHHREQQQLGRELLGFLVDFRTAQEEEAVRVAESAIAARRSAPSASTAAHATGPTSPPGGPVPEFYDPYAGSEVQVSGDWWLASDGRWYAPEVHPDVHPSPPAPGDVARLPDDEVPAAASRPVDPRTKPRLRSTWPGIGLFHSPGTAAL